MHQRWYLKALHVVVRSASVSGDNFVRLNMKVKKYQRKGGHISGPAYKRMQWKEKMKARSESFGSDKCFKCGGSGHWANKCRGLYRIILFLVKNYV